MPAVAAEDLLLLPRLPRLDSAESRSRAVAQVISAHRQREGAGFEVRRPFPGALSLAASDPFLLLDLPIGEPIAHYGPFVMNTRAEILAAIDDYQAGKLGIIPADQLAPRSFA